MKKAMKTIIVLCLIIISFAFTVYAETIDTKAPFLSMQVLGKKVSSNPPIIKDNRIFLPVRATGEALGFKCSWNDKTNTMEIKDSNQTVKVTVGNINAYVNGDMIKLDAVPLMYGERSYFPLSFVQSYFDYDTTYDNTKNQITINKKTGASKTKGVYVFGKNVGTGVMSTIKNGKVYIPLRFVGEALGYKVSWYSGISTMEMKSGNSFAKVTVGYGNAVLNDKTVKLEQSPIMYDSRVYVPISFIQNNFGYEVFYNSATKTVNIDKKKPLEIVASEPAKEPVKESQESPIEYKAAKIEDIIYDDSGGFPQLKIFADNPVKYKSFTMMNPDRMVVDIENSTLNTEFETKEIGKGGVIRVRIAQFSKSPNVVRVVMDLEDQQRCKLVQSNDKKSISLIYANIINPVSYIKEDGRDVLMVRGSQEMDTNVFRLDGPDRLVVDIRKSVLNNGSQVVEADTPYVNAVRTGQVDVGVARVVLDLKPGTYYDVENVGSLTKVYISDRPFSFFDYNKYFHSAYIDLSPGVEVEYQPIIDRANRVLKIMMPKDLDVEEKTYDINDNIIDNVKVTKETYGKQVYTVAAFKMKPHVEYELLSPAVTKLVSLKFKYAAKEIEQLTVIIDPGHGGKDPGATSIDKKTYEKDLNLDVALRLNRILKSIGFNTLMTRSDDRYVDLASRSGLANDSYADFFMSIHFNAFMSSAKGIETLYYPNEISEEYPLDNKKMAELFHKEIINALNRPSRGITPRPGLHVLNKTKMPAILAELGFMTNPEEFEEIKKEEYREMAARALAASIVRYYKEIEQINLDIDVSSIYSDPMPKDPYSLKSAGKIPDKSNVADN